MKKVKILTIFGTRPEAIKMAPVIMELKKFPLIFDTQVCITAQHKEMLYQVLNLFNIKADFDLNLMKPGQDLWNLTSSVLLGVKDVLDEISPDVVLVHGDTTTSFAASLSAFYAKIPVGHVEAGLRTFNKYYPFPEEINRVMADSVSSFHFAPTQRTSENLIKSGIDKKTVYLTGNTVIDALLYTVENHKFDSGELGINKNLKTILLTSHRRENFGKPLEQICDAVKILVKNNPNIEFVYPVHLNPNVKNIVYNLLGGIDRVKLLEPLEYAQFAALMKASYIILTDSGGIQEEAPSLGKPVLVLRDETERPEAVEYGSVKLVGPHTDRIIRSVQELLDSEENYRKMASVVNPYGDGMASERIVRVLSQYFETAPQGHFDIC